MIECSEVGWWLGDGVLAECGVNGERGEEELTGCIPVGNGKNAMAQTHCYLLSIQ